MLTSIQNNIYMADSKSCKHSPSRIAVLVLAVLVIAASSVSSGFAQQRQQTFSSAEAATRALFQAVQNHDDSAVMDILGAGNELASTGDDVQDKLEHEQFVQKYKEMHRLVREPDKTVVLYLGSENWPFPIPLVSNHGVWRFDSQAGLNEVLFRRIGDNEASAVGAFQLLVLAQHEYQRRNEDERSDFEYTTRFVVANGAQDGLDIKGDSAIPEELAKAGLDDQVTGGNSAVPYHGYYFRVLTSQGKHAPGGAKSYISNGKMTGGFAFLAYPAEYRSSGVKTFIAGSNGDVYEKDLGPDTAKIASAMTKYDPDSSWHVAEQYPGER